jgi:hypothetical protein
MESTIVVEELAAPFRVVCRVSEEELKVKFDEYWNANHELLVATYNVKPKKGKKGKKSEKDSRSILESFIPIKKIYREPIELFLKEKLDHDVLMVDGLDLSNNEGVYTLVMVYYKYPEFSLKEEVSFEVLKPTLQDLEEAVTEQLTRVKGDSTESDLEILAKYGIKDMEGFRSVVEQQKKINDDGQLKQAALSHVLSELEKKCVLPPIPQRFLDEACSKDLEMLTKRFKGDTQKLYNMMGVKNEQEAYLVLTRECIKKLLEECCWRLYKKVYAGDKDVVESVMEKVIWV